MTAPVRIDAPAWGDLRFATLARLCGFADAEHALIKVAKIWSWQTEHYTPDAPTYEVDPELVDSALGEGGAGHMVRARLAEEGPGGLLRIKGTKGRIEWLFKKRASSAAGGEATKRKHSNQTGPDGPLSAPVSAGPEVRPTPGPLPLALPPDQQISDTPAPRAIAQSVTYQQRQAWWKELNAAHDRLRRPTPKRAGIKPGTPDFAKSPNENQLLPCERFLRDGGYDAAGIDAKIRHVIAVAELEAERDQKLDYFKPAIIFDVTSANRFPRKVDTSLEEARTGGTQKPRTGPQPSRGTIGASTPHDTYGDDSKPAREVM